MDSTKALFSVVLAAALISGTVGCQTGGEINRTRTGALTGTLLGAGAGALIDKDEPARGALIGAAAGAALGGGIGHVLQRQKEAFARIEGIETAEETVLIQQPTAPPVTTGPGETMEPAAPAEVEQPALRLRMQSDVLFPVGSSALTEAGRAKIREIAEVLSTYPDSQVYVRGYTSSEGGDQMNYELSQRRAQVVQNELIAAGISPSRIQAQGMGPSNPIADNSTEAGRVLNRRVEIHVVPTGEAAM